MPIESIDGPRAKGLARAAGVWREPALGAHVPFGVKNQTIAAVNAELEPAIWFVAYYRRYQFAAGCGDEIRAAAARSDAASE